MLRVMQRQRSTLGVLGVFAAASLGFLGLDQAFADEAEKQQAAVSPQVSERLEQGWRPADTSLGATDSSLLGAPEAAPNSRRPAVDATIGEGNDALDESRNDSAAKVRAAGDLSFDTLHKEVGLPAQHLEVARIPIAEQRDAPPLTADIAHLGWKDADSEALRGQKSAENGGPAPLWLEAIASQFGVKARFIPLHRPSNTVSRYVDPCDKRDYRCQEFHDNFFEEDVSRSPVGMAGSIGAGFSGGIIRAAGVNRDIAPPLKWSVKPRFVGLEGAF